MEASFTKLWETCTWRQSYGANDLDHTKLNQEYLHEGSIFVHSKDVDGKPLLILRVKLHSKSKNLDELIRIVVYCVERIQRERHMSQLSLFFDMAGTGLATLDLEFVKRIVETFKLYYPNALNYILVFELAWVLNGKLTWKSFSECYFYFTGALHLNCSCFYGHQSSAAPKGS